MLDVKPLYKLVALQKILSPVLKLIFRLYTIDT